MLTDSAPHRQAADARRSRLLLFESTGEGIYGIDTEGRCTIINRAAAGMLGLNMHQLMHHSHADGRHFGEEDCPIFKAFRDGQSCRVASEVMWRFDGTRFSAEYSVDFLVRRLKDLSHGRAPPTPPEVHPGHSSLQCVA